METEKSIQIYDQTSNDLPRVVTAASIAKVREDAQRYPRYSSILAALRLEWLAMNIQICFHLLHINKYEEDDTEATVMAEALDSRMLKDQYMSDLTLPEIKEAFMSGIFGDYGEFYGLTASTLYGFLKAFINSPEKKAAAAIINANKKDQYTEAYRKKIREEMEVAKKEGSFVPTGKIDFQLKTVNDAINDKSHEI